MLNNINNFFNLFKTRRVKKTLAPNDIIPVGVRDVTNRSDYQPSGILAIDLINQIGVGGVVLSTAGITGPATLVGFNLNIPQYQGQLTITTTGTSGTCTLVGNTLNVPQYQGQITLTTTGTSGPSTLVGNTLNIPQYDSTKNVSCKININGTSGLSNTTNGVEFLAPYNTLVYNEDPAIFAVNGSKIQVLSSGQYMILARYSSYDMVDANNDFMRIAVTLDGSPVTLGTKLEYLNQGLIGTTINGEATKNGTVVIGVSAGQYVGITAYHTGANGGDGNQGYPVFDNSFFNQPYLQIVKLT
jgi:hypothetical protein